MCTLGEHKKTKNTWTTLDGYCVLDCVQFDESNKLLFEVTKIIKWVGRLSNEGLLLV